MKKTIIVLLIVLCLLPAAAGAATLTATKPGQESKNPTGYNPLKINESGWTITGGTETDPVITQHISIDGSKFSEDNPLVVTLNNVYIKRSGSNDTSPVKVSGYVKLILQGENTLEVTDRCNRAALEQAEVFVQVDSVAKKATARNGHLTIAGDGSLTAIGHNSGSPGIGGARSSTAAGHVNITIDGGKIKATGDQYGAGIGGRRSDSGNPPVMRIL